MALDSIPLPVKQLIESLKLAMREVEGNDVFCLQWQNDRLQMLKMDEPQIGAIAVDFLSGANQYRRKFGGGKDEAIAKAIGLKKGKKPSVCDATAGLGRDAFVLSSLGSRVHMMERCPMVAILLADGLRRASEDKEIGSWVKERMSLSCADSLNVDQAQLFQPDIVYLDPMFPEKKKSAMVKKEMRVFKELVGMDEDSPQLLVYSLKTATKKVVVKRMLHAPNLADKVPNSSIKSKKHRFDSYLV